MKTFSILLTVLFVGLQLTNYIAWRWWLVFSPILIYTFPVFFLIAFVFWAAL
jgi:hypothetical protein